MRILQSTRLKMICAKLIYNLIRTCGQSTVQRVTRKGINYELDLSEGIDLHIYLFGSFQKHIMSCLRRHKKFITAPPTFIDVGANIGAISLMLARDYPVANIFSIEPTDYALNKFLNNLELNPQFKSRIQPIQAYISNHNGDKINRNLYSSWSLTSKKGESRHNLHMGIPKESLTNTTTLDDLSDHHKIKNIDFIKIDTDGHELSVLQGSQNILKTYKPLLIFELALYELREQGQEFGDFVSFLQQFGYIMEECKTGKTLTTDNIRSIVPSDGSIDVIARKSN
jgi:FkbM family methyltransferase